MALIKATAYLNNLTKGDSIDYYLISEVNGTLTLDDLIERLRKREIATKNVDGKAFFDNLSEEIVRAVAEGYNIALSLCTISMALQGAIKAEDLGHPIPADRVNARINFIQGVLARKALADTSIFVKEQSAASGPVVQVVTDPTENVANTINVGGMVVIKGMRIPLKGDHATVGITFTKYLDNDDDRPVIESVTDGDAPEIALLDANEEVVVPTREVYPNTPTNLQFILPAQVTPGKWVVRVTTQATSASNTLTKEPRTYQYGSVITVKTRKF